MYTSILSGELNPQKIDFSGKERHHNGASSSGNDDLQSMAGASRLLSDYPVLLAKMKESLPNYDPDTSVGIKPYILPEPLPAYSQKAQFFQQLVPMVSGLYLRHTVLRISGLTSGPEGTYEMNVILSGLITLLKQVSAAYDAGDDPDQRYVLELCQGHLMAIILDLSLRFPSLEGVTRYGERELYATILDQPRPETVALMRTGSYPGSSYTGSPAQPPNGRSLDDIMAEYIPFNELMDRVGVTFNTFKAILIKHEIKVSELSPTRRYIHNQDFENIMKIYSKKGL
ncbi:MAG: hypothetical protein WD037_11465 [Balneolales bacterium]